MSFFRLAGVWLGCVLGAGAEPQRLPVFLADNHAESFAWMARTFDLDVPLWLVLVDEHTDASGAGEVVCLAACAGGV